jgi:uncharacterized protein
MTNLAPLREPEADGKPFWLAASEGRLILQTCRACGRTRFPPRCQCPHCWSPETDWKDSPGKGEIESITIVRRAPTAAFRDLVPYAIVAVMLREGVRMITNLIGEGALTAKIADEVVVCFERRPNGALPQFKLAEPNR